MASNSNILTDAAQGRVSVLMPVSLVVSVLAGIVYVSARFTNLTAALSFGGAEGTGALSIFALLVCVAAFAVFATCLYWLLKAIEERMPRNPS